MTDEVRFWCVNHPFTWYVKNPEIISRPNSKNSEHDANWNNIMKGHKVIYNAIARKKSPKKELVGLFEVKSDLREDTRRKLSYYDVKPLYIPHGDELPKEVRIVKDLRLNSTLQGTVNKLKPHEYKRIKSFLLGMDEPTNHEGTV